MLTITLASIDSGDYSTKLSFAGKEFPEQKFLLTQITCITPSYQITLPDIRISMWKLQEFQQQVKRVQYTGKARFEIKTHEREEFYLTIFSPDSNRHFYTDVKLSTRASFIHLNYEISAELLIR